MFFWVFFVCGRAIINSLIVDHVDDVKLVSLNLSKPLSSMFVERRD